MSELYFLRWEPDTEPEEQKDYPEHNAKEDRQ